MIKFVEHRVADRRILRLIQKWLKAGMMEEGKWSDTEMGTPQGSVISPLLANIYLHYLFDLWVDVWRKKYARGEVMVLRFADDIATSACICALECPSPVAHGQRGAESRRRSGLPECAGSLQSLPLSSDRFMRVTDDAVETS